MRLRHFWLEMRSSFWFVPALIVLGAFGLATLLVKIDATVELHVVKRWPLLFGAGADGARGLLAAVATSMITVAGVVFSITIVALSLTSSQYTSRVLRNFMRDRINQVVLGVFVGIFAYCLIVLRTIRGGEEGAFVPSLAVLGALVLAFVGIGYLIYFIHHVAISIQASSIISAAADETIAAIDHLFPEGLGDEADEDSEENSASDLERQVWVGAPALATGYIQSVDGDKLLELASKQGTMLRMERGIGEFVIAGTPLVSIAGAVTLDANTTSDLNSVYIIGRQRTIEQDAGFGLRQIVDVAMKALSPGVNDTTTAVTCVQYLGAILVRLAPRRMPSARRLENGVLRLISRGPDFGDLLAESFDQIRQNSSGNVAVMKQMIDSLESVAGRTASVKRLRAVRQQIALIAELAERSIPCPHDRCGVDQACRKLEQALKVCGVRSGNRGEEFAPEHGRG